MYEFGFSATYSLVQHLSLIESSKCVGPTIFQMILVVSLICIKKTYKMSYIFLEKRKYHFLLC